MSTGQNKIIDTTEIDLGIGGSHSRITYQVLETPDGQYEVWMFDPGGRKIESRDNALDAQLTMQSFVIDAKDGYGAVEISPFG